jgi:hypothetical protein
MSRGMDAATRVLVLANRTADSTQLHQQLLARHAQGPIAVTMLAPATWEVQDPHGAQSPRGGDCRRHKHLQAGGRGLSRAQLPFPLSSHLARAGRRARPVVPAHAVALLAGADDHLEHPTPPPRAHPPRPAHLHDCDR